MYDLDKVASQQLYTDITIIKLFQTLKGKTLYFCKATDSMQYHPPNAYQEVSNTNQFGNRTVRDYPVVLNIVGACAAVPRQAASRTRILVGHHKAG